LAVNEAVEISHRRGILTAASLMVGAPATADAVARARRMPELAVGLHLVLVRGRPLLPAAAVPDLVDPKGNFRDGLFTAGVAYFFRPALRRQLAAEIRTQFDAFRASGLALDHANCHNHLHLHPTVLGLILKIGADYGLKAVRLPVEPFRPSTAAAAGENAFGRLASSVALAPWSVLVARRLRRRGIAANDHLFGMRDSGRMTRERLLRLIPALPEGVSEIHLHPAAPGWASDDPAAAGYRHEDELAALTDPEVSEALAAARVERIAFRHLAAPR
jgi:hopanoid biosynthesis associated protein HpnK